MNAPVLSNLAYLAAVVAHIPLFAGYVRINAGKGHYQFFPILVAVTAWLVYDRISSLGSRRTAKFGIWNWLNSSDNSRVEKSADGVAFMLFAFASLILGTAAIVQSSFLVIPSVMMFAASWVISRFGMGGFKLAFPAWLLLLLAIPFPFNLDMVLVNKLQFLASRLASLMLDSLGQIHFREGLTLVTAKQQFFTEEACSGIRSLFSSIAAISVYGVFHRLSFPRHLFNWLQIIVWVIIGNAIRIAIVVFVAENWTQSIASGAPHEMLGIGVFAGIVLVALSTSIAIDRFKAVNADPFDEFEDETEIEATVVRAKQDSRASSKWINIAALCFFAMVLVFCVRLAMIPNYLGPRHFTVDQVVSAKANALPETIDGWTVGNFEMKSRPQNSLLAPNSSIWTLSRNGESGSGMSESLIISLDSPYHSYHDLTVCYNGLGWKLTTDYDLAIDGNDEKYSALNMSKRGQHGIVYFSAFDRQGETVTRSSSVAKTGNARRNILLFLGLGGSKDHSRLPVTQIQLIYESRDPIPERKKAELLKLFEQVQGRLKKSVLSVSGNGGG
jgi:exosortase